MARRQLFSKLDLLPIGVILSALGIGLYLCPLLPPMVPSHWNAAGEIDGYSSREFSVWLLPAIALSIYLFMTLLPLVDPRREREKEYNQR